MSKIKEKIGFCANCYKPFVDILLYESGYCQDCELEVLYGLNSVNDLAEEAVTNNANAGFVNRIYAYFK